MAPAHGPHPRPICVAHVVDQLRLAGLEYGVIKLVNRLDAARIRSIIVCMSDQAPEARSLLSSTVPVFELRKKPGRNWRVIGGLADRFRREGVDVVHSHNWPTFLYSVAAARLSRVAVLVHGEHGKDSTSQDHRRTLACRLLAKGVTQLCVVSRNIAEEIIRDWKISPRQVKCIPNGVDLQAFGTPQRQDAIRLELGLSPGDQVVMNTGAFRPIKDHTTLLRAFALVHRENPRSRLLLVGQGSADDPLAGLDRLATDLGVANAVRFAGVRTDIPRLLHTCDVYANSSQYEGMSNTILEAMAARRPVVATSVGGNPDLIVDGVTGFLVPAGEPETLASRIVELLRDPALRDRMGAAGRARMEACHSMPAMVEAYARLYEELFARLGARSQ